MRAKGAADRFSSRDFNDLHARKLSPKADSVVARKSFPTSGLLTIFALRQSIEATLSALHLHLCNYNNMTDDLLLSFAKNQTPRDE